MKIFNQKFNIVSKTCLITALFLVSFFIFTNSTQAAGLSELVPAPEIINLENGQTISSNMTINGMSINFSNIAITLDGQDMGYAQAEIGNDGWQEWEIELPKDLEIGEHKLEAVTEYFKNTYSTTTSVMFNHGAKFPSPTLFNPVLNFETNYQQPWIVGLSYNDVSLEIYINEKLDGTLLVDNHESGVTDFRYLPSEKLSLGFHTVKVLAKHVDGQVSDFSNEIIFEIKSGVSKMQAPDLPKEIGEFVPPVPAPTLVEPKQGLVTKDNKLVVTGLVHNEHQVKIFANDDLIGEFMPEVHESGVTSFIWQAEEQLEFGSHKVWAEAVNLSGQSSGQSNTLRFIVLAPEHFASEIVGKIAAATEEDPATDEQLEGIIDKINGLMAKANQWANWWKYFIAIVVLVSVVLIVVWIFIFRNKEDDGDKIDIKDDENSEKRKVKSEKLKKDIKDDIKDIKEINNDEPIILGPDISYSDPNDTNEDFYPTEETDANDANLDANDANKDYERDENMPPPPPPVDSPTLGF